jgi:hypothetical protein
MKFLILILALIPLSLFSQVKKIKSATKKVEKSQFEEIKSSLDEEKTKYDSFSYVYIKHMFFNSKLNAEYNIDSAYVYIVKSRRSLHNMSEIEYKEYCEELNICYTTLEQHINEIIKEAYIKYNDENINNLEFFNSFYGNNEFTELIYSKIQKLKYEKSISLNTILGYREFIKTYNKPDNYTQDVKSRIEQILYDSLLISFNFENYTSFINEFPNSKFNLELRRKYAESKYKIVSKSQDFSDKLTFLNEFSDYKLLNIDSIWISIKKEVVLKEIQSYINSEKTDYIDFLNFTFSNLNYINNKTKSETLTILNQKMKSDLSLYATSDLINKYKLSFGETTVYNSLDSLRLINEINKISNEENNLLEKFLLDNQALIKKYNISDNIKLLTPIKIEEWDISGYGFVNKLNNNIEIYPLFQEVRPFVNGFAAVKFNEKWGFINLDGQVIIELIYNEVKDFYKDVCCVNQDGLWSLLNKENEVITNMQFQDLGYFNSGYINVKSLTSGWGYINTKGEFAKTISYRNATPFDNGYAIVSENDEYQLIDSNFNKIDVEYRNSNFFKTLESKCYGSWESGIERWTYCEPNAGEADWEPKSVFRDGRNIIINGIFQFNLDKKGLKLVPLENIKLKTSNSEVEEDIINNKSYKRFDVIRTEKGYGYYLSNNKYLNNQLAFDNAKPFINNRAIVYINNKCIIIDTNGNQIGEIYNNVKRINSTLFIANDGYFDFLIDENANVLSSYYEEIEDIMFFGTFRVRSNLKYGLIDNFGNELFDPSFELLSPFNGEKAIARIKQDCGYKNYKSLCDFNVLIDINGVWVSKPTSSRIIFTP